jgi:predicted ATPase
LRDFVLSLARGQRLLLVVDDVDEIDEPSAAWLAALAHKTERNGLLLTLSVDSEPRHASASLRLLRLVAQRVELEQLTAEQTLTLVGSLFGDVPNLQLLAAKIYMLAQGNPRATMDLAQHLRERGLARYEAGSWLLPATIADGDLPKTLSDALAGRLAGLSSDARSLLEVMCLADGDALSLKSYVELTRFDNHARAYAAFHELEAACAGCPASRVRAGPADAPRCVSMLGRRARPTPR